MDDEIQQMFILLDKYIKNYLNTTSIGKIKWTEMQHTYTNIPIRNKYDELKLIKFITLYKIDRLINLNIINESIGKKLKDLLYAKKIWNYNLNY